VPEALTGLYIEHPDKWKELCMRTHVAVSIFFLALAPALLFAQSCPLSTMTFQGNYAETGNGSGSCGGGYPSCTVNHSVSADVAFQYNGSCSFASWGATDSNFAATVNDTLFPVGQCSDGTSQTLAVQDANPQTSYSSYQLTINPSTFIYTFYPYAITNVKETWLCDGNPVNTQSTQWGVTSSAAEQQYYNNFTLPPTIQPLIVNGYTFNTYDDNFDLMMPWTFSFTLNPSFKDCDDCRKKGGPGVPVSSTASAQNQSLGEDLPIAGTEFFLHYEGSRAPGASANTVASADAAMIGGWTLSVHHAYDASTNTLFFGNGGQRNAYQLGGTPFTLSGLPLITSEDGSEVYLFSSGEHLETLRALTGAMVYVFGYDSAQELVTITDASGNVTTIQRNGSEQPTAIVSPYGQTTTLVVDSNGFLSEVTDPLGHTAQFTNTNMGLISSRIDQNGNTFTYKYDGGGKLIQDSDPIGGYVSLSRANGSTGFSWTDTETTSMGLTSTYETNLTLPWVPNNTSAQGVQHTNVWPDGLSATSSETLQNNALSDTLGLPDGASETATYGPDPVWGIQIPIINSETIQEGNLTMNITGSRSTTLGTPGDPFSVTTETDSQTINGREYTSTFTAANHSYLIKTPVGRTFTVGIDSLERIASTQYGTLAVAHLAYDSHGRLASTTQGTRKSTFTYGTNGFLASMTDPLKLTTGFAYDADGRLATTTLPDGRIIGYTYDANGNLASVTPPGKFAHTFAYNAVDMPSAYTPPAVSGTGPTTYTYDLDRNLTKITRPDGNMIQFGYDNAGRLSSTITPTETTTYSYDPNTGNLTAAAVGSGETLNYGYNGPLQTSSALTGTVAGAVSRVYNDNFWVASESINGANTVNFTYDNDGLVTKAGSLAVALNAKDGLITKTTLGSATDSRTYDAFGELSGDTDKYRTATLYEVKFTRDADARVSTKTETIGGKTTTYTYTYDQAGRLAKVTQNGAALSSYTYDSNSNRLTATTSSGTVTGTYDAQDRLQTYGNATYTYTANGELESQTVGAQTTNYTYDVLGNLAAAALPNRTNITYIVDPENHRVGKEVNGALQTGLLFDGDRIVAQLNGSNQIVSQFIYGTGSTSPDYMVSGGVTYRIFSDQLGSPILVVNTSTGAVAEQIAYDEFGNVLSDSNPGFQPFGFAGGLYDQDTKLVRFGARDYNPSIGRWTAKDPILFNGGDTNLFGYVLNDPVNLTDPRGTDIAFPPDFYTGEQASRKPLTSQACDCAYARTMLHLVQRERHYWWTQGDTPTIRQQQNTLDFWENRYRDIFNNLCLPPPGPPIDPRGFSSSGTGTKA
jgi:RHS repeat-associated protein